MAASAERSFAQELNTWVQTVGILIAAGWGVYTFVYKEYILPQSAPVNITVNLQLKKIGASVVQVESAAGPLIAVEMRVTATNPSSRTVHLLPTAWVAYGFSIDSADESTTFAKDVVTWMNSDFFLDRTWNHAAVSGANIVAAGHLFPDGFLQPNETATRTLLIFMPRDRYDYLDVATRIPTMAKQGDIELEWRLDEAGNLHYDLFDVSETGERTKMATDSDEALALEFQSTTSFSALSLWQ